ncbi:hypothetical protein J6590_044903 [Homalodisca vitripennis]|nr:hypothetical protein J6590_044903 [Homalodisca vitripennis]
MSCMEGDIEEIISSSLINSATRLYQAAALTGPPSVYGKLKNWLLDEEIASSDDSEYCGGAKILKKVGCH